MGNSLTPLTEVQAPSGPAPGPAYTEVAINKPAGDTITPFTVPGGSRGILDGYIKMDVTGGNQFYLRLLQENVTLPGGYNGGVNVFAYLAGMMNPPSEIATPFQCLINTGIGGADVSLGTLTGTGTLWWRVLPLEYTPAPGPPA